MTPQSPRPRVLLLCGGRSTEHSISCVSAAGVLGAIDPQSWEVVLVGITRDGDWVPVEAAQIAGQLPVIESVGTTVSLHRSAGSVELLQRTADGATSILGAIDVVFPVLHGPYGEDGAIQGLVESFGLPYVGSGVLTSAVSMDKAAMKDALRAAGLAVGPYEVIRDAEWRARPGSALARVESTLTLPVFVKPARAGSSIGITKVKAWAELEAAILAARDHDPLVVVEQGLEGREIECGVLEGVDGGPAQTSVCAEIRVVGDHEFYDFEAKYLDTATELDVPADLAPEVERHVRELAARAFVALGCEGLARVDFFVEGHGSVVINEVNTMPGFTPSSLFPRMWDRAGVSYPEVVQRLLVAATTRTTGLR